MLERFLIGQYGTVHGDVISHVNISHVMVEDGGLYSCTAENRAGKVTHAARLNVYGKFHDEIQYLMATLRNGTFLSDSVSPSNSLIHFKYHVI